VNIKAIAIDLDGTLLNEQKEISEFNKKAISKLIERGIKVYLATGRIYKSMRPYRLKLGINTKTICYNGAMIVDSADNILQEISLEAEYGKLIIDIARKYDAHLNIFQNEIWYIERERDEAIFYKKNSGLKYTLIDFDEFETYHFTKTMFVGSPEKLKIIEKDILNQIGDKIYHAYSKPMYFEMLNKTISKGAALAKVLKLDKIEPKNLMAIGDAYNDLEMLRYANIGVVMENAPIDIKNEFQDNIAPSNDESGVGKFLNNYFKLDI